MRLAGVSPRTGLEGELVRAILLAVGLIAGTGSSALAAEPGGPERDAAAPRAAAPRVALAQGGKALLPILVAAGEYAGDVNAHRQDELRQSLDKKRGRIGYLHHLRSIEGTLNEEQKRPIAELGGLEKEAARDAKVLAILEWLDDLKRCLNRMTGAAFDAEIVRAFPPRPGPGLYVGQAADFPWARVPADLAEEEFALRTLGDSQILLIGGSPYGVSHAVYTFLDRLGCRWFFPGEAWEVIPRQPDITVALDERQKPDFPLLRTMGYGGGASPRSEAEKRAWDRRNRLSPIYSGRDIGETWFGLDRAEDFKAHPDWFAEVDGKRQATKPCYTNPEVIQKGIDYALKEAASGRRMVSLTPPDWVGFCECARCRAMLKGGKERRIRFPGGNLLFADMPDGQLACLTSETVFHFVNKVAEAVAEKCPGVLLSCLAYSHHSHPPTFGLQPNVYVTITTTFFWSPLAGDAKLDAFTRKARHVGIYEYYDVWEWFKDSPYGKDYGAGNLEYLVISTNDFKRRGLEGMYTEMSDNWGARGLGYYVAARLWWDAGLDTEALMRDSLEKAFGPAAGPMEEYYAQFYGPPRKILPTEKPDLADKPYLEYKKGIAHPILKRPDHIRENSYKWLTEAAALVADLPACRTRVDQIRMFHHYYFVLRQKVDDAAKAGDEAGIVEAARDETVFAARLLDTHMIHSWALLGEGFNSRFGRFKAILSKVPESQMPVWQAGWPQNKDKPAWRRARADVPAHDEMERIWAADKAALGP